MSNAVPHTDDLVRSAAAGDDSARGALLQRHRRRLRRMVALRMDRRLAARVDPSDVVQEALAEAARRLDGYLREQPLPFYPWLRQLAWERLVAEHRRHIQAGRRSVRREELAGPALPDASALELAERLAPAASTPSAAVQREELRLRVRQALEQLPERDREILVLRHLEQLTAREAAAVLGLTEAAVKSRALRAVRRLRELLGPEGKEGRS
jgi:RNA polymerase sigma-70 factor (ECF subfamily)